MTDWRNEPATEAQEKRMEEDGIAFSENITKGEASDLIGSLVDPEEEQIEILKFFRVPGFDHLNQTEARKKISEIFSDPGKAAKWESRPASKHQKEIYEFFNITVVRGLTYNEAQTIIDALFEDETKLEAWENHEDEKNKLEGWFEDYYELINEDRIYYGCRKIGKQLFRKIVDELESSGVSKSAIEGNSELVFQRAIEIDPSIKRGARNQIDSSNRIKVGNGKGCATVFLVGITMATVVVLVASFVFSIG